MKTIDLKSDLNVLPSEDMWQAMRSASPGWVIDREDPQVRRLEQMGAKLTGKEAAVFVPTGRIGVLVALMTYCNRGNQLIAGRDSHLIWCEQWGMSYVCGAFPRLVEEREGRLDPGEIARAIVEAHFSHQPVTDLVCIENTHNGSGGRVTGVAQTAAICEAAHQNGAKVFIDGARILYAAAALGVQVEELVAPADAVMFSLIKGIGSPMGALLCGPAEDIARAFVNLRRIGAHAIHRAGIFAAAAIVALEAGFDHLAEDIRRAKMFAGQLKQIPGIEVDLDSVESNIVMADVGNTGLKCGSFLGQLEHRGVSGHRYTDRVARFTFHRQISDSDVEGVLEAIRFVVESGQR